MSSGQFWGILRAQGAVWGVFAGVQGSLGGIWGGSGYFGGYLMILKQFGEVFRGLRAVLGGYLMSLG